jgi:cysteine desulfurase/selenocysteine lyase
MREPPVKKVLYWCDECNVPLIAKTCGCRREGRRIDLLQPYDVRPALAADMALITKVITIRFGAVPLKQIVLLNKTGGADRADLVIMNGERFGWLMFDPVSRSFSLDIAPEALPFLVGHATKGIIDLGRETGIREDGGRVGGKRLALKTPVPDGTVIVKYKNRYGTGMVRDGSVKVKELLPVFPRNTPDPGWDVAVQKNRYHLKNLERNAIRLIKQHRGDRPTANISFSGGKDSTAVLHMARKAGVTKAFFIDTGIEFPETVDFVRSLGVEVIRKAVDFWQAAEKAGPPGKDNRWCCKLLKLHPLKLYLAEAGPCITIQGNRWYESWNRAGLEETSQNPANPLQLNISPIRNWRALEVFLYLWWQGLAINPLYDKGLERIGCFLCPAMLESEYEELKRIRPEFAERWTAFLESWAARKGYPAEFSSWGLWRWRALPPKMRELCRQGGIAVNKDYTLVTGPARAARISEEKKKEIPMKTAETIAGDGFDVQKVRRDFPILGEGIIYLDNAATSFSPEPVLAAMTEFEHSYRANVGRGIHRLARIATQRYWHAHEKVASFIGAKEGITVFTRNTTDAINMVAGGLRWKAGDRVVTTALEHHSNLLPWRNLKRLGVELNVIGINADFSLDLAALEKVLSPQTRLVAVTHASNVLGVVTPVQEIAQLCHENEALLLVDAAQSVPHMPVDVSRLGCDFLAFSGHKMLGPTGTGVLWMKDPIPEPFEYGGGMVEAVTDAGIVTAEGYQKYEAGTPHIAGGIGLGAAADYLSGLGMQNVRRHGEHLTARLIHGLQQLDGVHVYAPRDPADRIGVVSFTVDTFHPHEVAQQLDESADILVRSGHHCCQPLLELLRLPEGTVRASFCVYNTEEEVDMLLATLAEMVR